ncbi:MAG: hypothetical protein L0213_03835, partial [Candidatus Dadabacteria bacterium]|nr:hypothetical protein [Candidatus Dadabacteria bacterium]
MNAIPRSKFESIKKTLSESGKFRNLSRRIEAGEREISLSGLGGSSRFFLIHALKETTKRPLLIISPTAKRAESASQDLSFFLGRKPPVLLKKEIGTGRPI